MSHPPRLLEAERRFKNDIPRAVRRSLTALQKDGRRGGTERLQNLRVWGLHGEYYSNALGNAHKNGYRAKGIIATIKK